MTDGRRTSGQHPARPPWHERAAAAVTDRIGYKAAAVFFAVVLWLVVSAEEPTEEVVPVRFAPLTDSLTRIRGELPQVRALVVGRARDILRLYANPPTLRPVITADAGDTVSIILRPQDVNIPSEIGIVRDVQPRQVQLAIISSATRTLPVASELQIVPDTGLQLAGTPRFVPQEVVVTGDRRRVLALDSVPTVSGTLVVGDTGPHVIPLDTSRIEARVRPASVQLFVPLAPDTAPSPLTRVGSRRP